MGYTHGTKRRYLLSLLNHLFSLIVSGNSFTCQNFTHYKHYEYCILLFKTWKVWVNKLIYLVLHSRERTLSATSFSIAYHSIYMKHCFWSTIWQFSVLQTATPYKTLTSKCYLQPGWDSDLTTPLCSLLSAMYIFTHYISISGYPLQLRTEYTMHA